MNPAIASRANHAWIANGLYDPSITGTGHQPRGFDQMMQFYSYYTVVGSKITVKYIPEVTKAVNSEPCYMFIAGPTKVGDPLSTEAADASIFESGMVKNKVVIRGGDTFTNGRLPQITDFFSAKRFYGTKSVVGNFSYNGSSTANPAAPAYWALYLQNISGNDVPAYNLEVTIDYLAVFTEPIQIGSS